MSSGSRDREGREQQFLEELRKFYPGSDPGEAAYFVNVILSSAWFAKDGLDFQQSDLVKEKIRAELESLLKALSKAEDKLRRLSPDVDRLLGPEVAPLDCADELCRLIEQAEVARKEKLDELPKSPRRAEKESAIAIELAIRVLCDLDEFGIKPSATHHLNSSSDEEHASPAVQILKLIGDYVGLEQKLVTWRDIVLKATGHRRKKKHSRP